MILIFFLTFFIDKKLIIKTISLFLIIICLASIIVSTNQVFKERFKNEMLNKLIQNKFNIYRFIEKTEYGKIYYSAHQVFLEKMLNKKSNKIGKVVDKIKKEALQSRLKMLGLNNCFWPLVDYGGGFREVADSNWRNPECYLSTDSDEADRKDL